jgi:hypothetical protein
MKKLLIILIIFVSCSKENIEEIYPNCNCNLNLVQVTSNGIHLVKGSSNVLIDCVKNGIIFDRKFSSSNKLIQYKTYICTIK